MMQMRVEDVDAGRRMLCDRGIETAYDVRLSHVDRQPWPLRDFAPPSPSEVLW